MDSSDIEKWRVELDSYAHVEDGVEYWLARDLMEPMGYTRWENFAEVVKRAKVSCETNKTPVDSHFRDTTKMVTAGVAARAVKDHKLTRYACYLIAQNGDSNKPEIALAQAYFAVQTRRQELIEQRFAGARCGAKAPCALRWQMLTHFLSSAPRRVRPHARLTKKRPA